MLNKDQYNQNDYNDYYEQEKKGSKIKRYREKEGGFVKKAIFPLGLIVVGFAGYFGFKSFNTSTENYNTTKEKIVSNKEASDTSKKLKKEEATPEIKKIEEKVVKTQESDNKKTIEATTTTEKTTQEVEVVDNEVKKSVKEDLATQTEEKSEKNEEMSTDEISKIVDLVMNKMDEEKVETPKTNNDTILLSALQNSNSDSEEVKTKDTEPTQTNVKIAIQKDVEEIDANNKVTLDNDAKNSNKSDITELSEQIKKLLNMSGIKSTQTTEISVASSTNKTTNYEQSLSKEIKVRKNEMRIIVVKAGDTLNKVAQRAYGKASSYQKIFDANPNIKRADRIYIGQKLRIPK